jgi:hypothetical protein
MLNIHFECYCPLCGQMLIGEQLHARLKPGDIMGQTCERPVHEASFFIMEIIKPHDLQFRILCVEHEGGKKVMRERARWCYQCGSELIMEFEYVNFVEELGAVGVSVFYRCLGEERIWQVRDEITRLLFIQYDRYQFELLRRQFGMVATC